MTVRKKYRPTDSHLGPKTVRFVPIQDGDVVELGDTSPNAIGGYGFYHRWPAHLLLGFKAGPAGKRSGWIVVLVDEQAAPGSKPIKHRSLRAVGKAAAK